jgi:pilus assembly protein CpaE
MSLLARTADTPAVTDRSQARGLCVVSDAASEAVLHRLAALLPAVQLEVRRGDVRTALKLIERNGSPGVLLVDCSSHELPVTAMEALADVCDPGVRVIAVGERNDIALYREMMRLGADDYLFKPLSTDLLLRALGGPDQAPGAADSARRGRLIAVHGVRGGAGATTVAVNLAAQLASGGRRRVALVDLDPVAGTAALMLDKQPTGALLDALQSPDRVDDLFVERALIPVGERFGLLAAAGAAPDQGEADPAAVAAVLQRLRARHHYVVVDVPRGAAAHSVLQDASFRLLVADPGLAAARDTGRLTEQLSQARGRTVVVLNRSGLPGGLTQPEFAKASGRAPDITLPYRPKPLAEAATMGQLAIGRDRAFAAGIAALATDLAGGALAAPSGLLPRLRRGLARLGGRA